MTAAASSTRNETPVFIPAGQDSLFGIVTRPSEGEGIGSAVLVLPGGGSPTSTGVNRISVRLCRRLAEYGYHALRLDYHGIGQSTGSATRFRLNEPFIGDAEAALHWLEGQGLNRFVLVGWCFGSRTALACAARAHGVRDLILVASPVRDFEMGERSATGFALRLSTREYIKRALRPRVIRGIFHANRRRVYVTLAQAKWRRIVSGRGNGNGGADGWVSAAFLEQLSKVLGRGVRVLFLYGEADDFYEEFQRARTGRLGEILAGGSVEVRTMPGELHGFTQINGQESALEQVIDWVCTGPNSVTAEPTAKDTDGLQLD